MNGTARSTIEGARSRLEPERRERDPTSDLAVRTARASGEAETVSDSDIERREPMLVSSFVPGEPPTAVSSRDGTAGARGPVGAVLYLALIGFVAAGTIGIFFGAGFSLLFPPSATVVVDPISHDPKRADGDTAATNRESAPVSQEPAASGAAAIAAIPGLLAGPPSIGSSAPGSPPVSPVTEPFSQTSLLPGSAPSPPGSLAPAARAGPAPLAATSSELSSEKADHAEQNTRPAVKQVGGRLAAGRQSAHRHKHAENPAAFGKLITQLTGEANSVDQQLTPPRASLPPPGFGASHAP